MTKYLDEACALVFTDQAGRLFMLDVTINDKGLHLNSHVELPDLFWQIKPFLITSHWIVLANKWKVEITIGQGCVLTNEM